MFSVIIITKNEERNIVECLDSVNSADEIVIVDSGSTDRTVELSRKYTNKIFIIEWKGYADAKMFALDQVTNEWVLWLDADERVPPELLAEIRKVVRDESVEYSAYEVARRAYFLGKWIRHCGWYPGFVVRLFRKNKAEFTNKKVHESLEINGKIGRLSNDLVHYTDENLFHYFSKFNSYTSLAAEDLFERGNRPSTVKLLINPLVIFLRMYIIRLGFLDGMHGLVLSLLSSAYVFIKYAKLREIK